MKRKVVFKKQRCQQHFFFNKTVDIFVTWIKQYLLQFAEIRAGRGKKKIPHVDILLKS